MLKVNGWRFLKFTAPYSMRFSLEYLKANINLLVLTQINVDSSISSHSLSLSGNHAVTKSKLISVTLNLLSFSAAASRHRDDKNVMSFFHARHADLWNEKQFPYSGTQKEVLFVRAQNARTKTHEALGFSGRAGEYK